MFKDEEGELFELPQQERRGDLTGEHVDVDTRTHAALCVVTELHDLYSVFSGSKQWPVRMSRTEHQQRGPFKTKLPDWLESAVGVIKEERSKADTLFALCIQIRTMLCYVI